MNVKLISYPVVENLTAEYLKDIQDLLRFVLELVIPSNQQQLQQVKN